MLARRRATKGTAKALSVPVPMGSVNTVSSGLLMPPEDCIYRRNLIPSDYGNRVRLGSREWCTGLTGGADDEVRALLPFTGSTASASRLFAATQSGIWDVTGSSASPSQVVAFPTSDATSGHGTSLVFSSAAGHFLCYWDESNGYYVYAESGDTWTAGGPSGSAVSGVTAANLCHGLMWKRRLWMVEKGTGKGWYLGTNAIGGAATEFNFGAQFKQGGSLRGLYAWTGDGGAGIDDHMVAISDGGDVSVYAGTDPATVGAFGIKGVWSVGGVPQGRRLASDFGGELLIMSTRGLISARELVDGVEDTGQFRTSKIGNLWNRLQIASANLRGWSMALHPLDATLLVTVPQAVAQPSRVLAMSLTNKGSWSEYTDLACGIATATYANGFYYGTHDGRVMVMDGHVDGITLSSPNSYAAIPFSMLGAFSTLGNARQKRVQLVEASFISEGAPPPHVVEARYRLNLSDITSSPLAAVQAEGATWDVSTWGAGLWAPEYTASQQMQGATGIGPEVAIAIRGTAAARTILSGFRVVYDEGGVL
jgi:hypothetical protein